MFSVDDLVLIWTGNSYEVGIIIRKYKRRGYRVYDVAVERGPVFVQIRADNKKANIFIDSQRTKAIIPKITTKLSPDTKKNIKIDFDEL